MESLKSYCCSRGRSGQDVGKSEAWVIEVLDHVGDSAAKERIQTFLSTQAARRIIDEWILAEVRPPLAFTDMSDVYKLSMMGAFAQIQRRLDQEHGKGAFNIRFSLNVRKSSELPLEEIFRRAATEGSRWAEIRDVWLRQVFALTARRFDTKMLREMPQALPPPLKGVVRLGEETLKEAESQPQAGAISLRIYLKQKGTPSSAWLEIVTAGDQNFMVKTPGGGSTEGLREAIIRLSPLGFEIVCDAEGPWHLVTFCETSLMQETAVALGQGMQLLRGWSDVKFYAIALQQLDSRMCFLADFFKTGNPFDVFLFAGRRSTHVGFHLLQNLWCARRLANYKGTSSLFAYRVFRDYGWINADGTPQTDDINAMPLVGTHAHEGSMGFQALAAEADDEFEYPISSLLWHLNYWLLTGNQATLPDTIGCPAFVHLLRSLQLPPQFVERWNTRHGPSRQLKGGRAIAEELTSPAIGGLVRQDSGSVSAFVQSYFPSPILPKVTDGKLGWVSSISGEPSLGYKCLASEIGSDEDVREARALGYLGMGTGGYLGEKPWKAAGDHGPKGDKLNHRVDLVAKVSSVQRPGHERFFPVKLGDYSVPGEWHSERPGKFAVSPEIQDSGNVAEEERIFKRFQRQGEVLEAGGQLSNLGNYAAHARKPKRFDSDAEWRQQRFNAFWDKYCFIGMEP